MLNNINMTKSACDYLFLSYYHSHFRFHLRFLRCKKGHELDYIRHGVGK